MVKLSREHQLIDYRRLIDYWLIIDWLIDLIAFQSEGSGPVATGKQSHEPRAAAETEPTIPGIFQLTAAEEIQILTL